MSHCLSNLAINPHVSSPTALFCPNIKHLPVFKRNLISARAAQGRDNLDDYLKIANNKQQIQQPTPTKRPPPVAPAGLWDRFPTARTLQQMMETMDRIMEDPLAYSVRWPATEALGGYSRGRTPWEIKEGEQDYKMRFDMPGMTKEDVKVWIEEKMLVVKAEKVPNKASGSEEENAEEWSAKSYGRYNSRIALPENVDFEKIKAEVKDGVLYITIPKAVSSAKVFDVNVE